jgi:hypothetical protein
MSAMGCPSAEDALLDLLDAPAAASTPLQVHVAGCPACAQKVQALQQVYEALGPAHGPVADVAVDGALLQRVQAQVVAAAHIDRPAVLLRRAGLATLSILLAVGVWLLGHRHALATPAGVGLAVMPLLLAAVSAAPRWLQRLAVAGTLVGVSAALLHATSPSWLPFARGVGCLGLWASGVLGPALLLRQAAPGGSALRGALLGAAIFAGGATMQRALCELGGAAHLLAFHLAPWLLGVAALAWLGRRAEAATSAA